MSLHVVNLFDVLSSVVETDGERLAIAEGEGTTYRQLLNRARQIGRELQSTGSAEDQPVGILADHGTPMLTALLGTWASGRIALPLDKRWAPSVVEERLAHAEATVLLCDDANSVNHRTSHDSDRRMVNLDFLALRDAGGESGDARPIKAVSQRPAVIFSTSGTTGHPKGVLHSHQALLHNFTTHARLLHITTQDRGLLLASLSTISGLTDSMRILLNGGTLIPYELASGGLSGLINRLDDGRPTIVHLVPTVFRRLCAMLEDVGHPERVLLLRSVRVLHLGGETVTRGDFEEFRRFFPNEAILLHNLGCTEVPSFRQSVMGTEWAPTSETLPLGQDADGKKVELVDTATGTRIVAADQPGEIIVRSRQTAMGYWRDDALTSQSFRATDSGEVLYSTGDIGQWTANGALVHLGRRDDQVKLLGRAVSLGQIEAKLMDHPEVVEAAVVAVQRPQSIRLVAFCSGSQTLHQTGIQQWAAESLEAWQVPRCLVLPELPTLANGKIDRRQLQTLASSYPTRDEEAGNAPRTETEVRLARIWMRVLGIRAVGRNDTFADQGGDSLHAVEVLAEVEREFGRQLQFGDLYQYATLERIAARLDSLGVARRTARYVDVFRAGPSPVLVIGYGETAQAVADGITDDRGVLFLKIPGLHDRPIRYRSIASSLASFAAELQDLGNEPPSAIVGYSYGGLLAYALAHELWEAGARPAVTILIEPATPLRGRRTSQPVDQSVRPHFTGVARRQANSRSMPRRRLWQKVIRPANWRYLFRYSRMLMANELGRLRGERCWELFRPAIRWNSRRFIAPAYNGEVLLVGTRCFLKTHLPQWRELVSGPVRPLALSGDQRHHAYLDPENEPLWLRAMCDYLKVAESNVSVTDSSAEHVDVQFH